MSGEARDDAARTRRSGGGEPDGGGDDALSEAELDDVVGGLSRGWAPFDVDGDDEGMTSV